jgi:hypothetical protein
LLLEEGLSLLRKALFELRTVRLHVREALPELEPSRSELKEARDDVEESLFEVEQARRDLRAALLDLKVARPEIEAALPVMQPARSDVEAALRQIHAARRQLEAARSDFEASRAELRETHSPLPSTHPQHETNRPFSGDDPMTTQNTVPHAAIAILNLPTKVPALILYAQGVAKGLGNNPSFPNPSPSVAQILAAILALNTTETAAMGRTKGAVLARNNAKAALGTKLRGADATYVWLAAREGVPVCTLDREILARGGAVAT